MKVVIVFAFFHQPCFLESDTFFGGVFGFFHAGKEDFMFTESLIDLVNGGVKVRTFDSLVEQGWGDMFGFQEASECDAYLEGTCEVPLFPQLEEPFGHGDAVLGGAQRS